MKKFKRSSLPDFIEYNGEKYKVNIQISSGMTLSSTKPEKVIEALKSTGKKGVLVEVFNSNLKGKTDLHGKPYKPSKWIYTNE